MRCHCWALLVVDEEVFVRGVPCEMVVYLVGWCVVVVVFWSVDLLCFVDEWVHF